MTINVEMLDDLIGKCKTPEDFFGENGLLKQFIKAVTERALQAELSDHLGYEKHDPKGKNSGNSRNGSTAKTVKGTFGETEIEVPRDRQGTFEPQFIQKRQKRFDGFDEKILSMYARGALLHKSNIAHSQWRVSLSHGDHQIAIELGIPLNVI